MKKAVLLTLSLMSTPLLASSQVTMYGIIDAGVSHKVVKINNGSKKQKNIRNGFQDSVMSGSRWGLRGKEQLSQDLYTVFQLEGGVNLSDGTSSQGGRMFGRRATIGLDGPLGLLTFGRQDNVADDFVSIMDPFGTGWSQASATESLGYSITDRYDSAVKYISPSLNGFKFGLISSPFSKEVKTEINNQKNNQQVKEKNHSYSLGGYYEGSIYQIGTTFERIHHTKHNLTTTEKERKKSTAWNIGGTIDIYGLRYHALFGQQRNGLVSNDAGFAGNLIDFYFDPNTSSALYGNGLRQQAWLLGLTYSHDSSQYYFSYQQNHLKNKAVFDGKIKTNIVSAAYSYSLSKRTNLYTSASYGKGSLTDWSTQATQRSKLKSREITMGLNHRF